MECCEDKITYVNPSVLGAGMTVCDMQRSEGQPPLHEC